MDEYISKKSVIVGLDYIINELNKLITDDSPDDGCTDIKNQVEEIKRGVLNIPPEDVQPVVHWISCSERLPEVGTYVLISKNALNFRSNLPNVCTAHRSCDPRSGKEEWNDMLFGKLDDGDVLAWMPLPEPYQEEGKRNG